MYMVVSFNKPLYFLLVIATALLVFTDSVFPFNSLLVITMALLVITAAYFMAFPSFATVNVCR